jgi:beta-galactosidase GanA
MKLVYSPDTFWFGADRGNPVGAPFGHVAEFRGVYAALTDSRHPFDVLMAGSIRQSDLMGAKLTWLPGATCLNVHDIKVLSQWVEQGGWLICTADTGQADENGQPHDSFISPLFPKIPKAPKTVDGAYLSLNTPELGLQVHSGLLRNTQMSLT